MTVDGVPNFRTLLDRAAVREVCDRIWPRLTPQEVLRRLYASPVRLRHAAKGVIDPEEAEALRRPSRAGWTDADVALLDELTERLGRRDADDGGASGQRAQELAGESFQLVETALAEEMQAALENRTADCPRCGLEMAYGHADDGTLTLTAPTPPAPGVRGPRTTSSATTPRSSWRRSSEDLRPRLHRGRGGGAPHRRPHLRPRGGGRGAGRVGDAVGRAIARRCRSRSLTVVGDLDQASQPWSIDDWSAVLELAGTGTQASSGGRRRGRWKQHRFAARRPR